MRRFLVTAMALAMVLTAAVPASADLASDLAEVEVRIDQLRAQIDSVQGARTEYADRVLEAAAALQKVNDELAAAQDRLDRTEADIAATEADIADLEQAMAQRGRVIADLRSTAAEEKAAALERAVQAYMSAHAALTERFATDASGAGVGLVYADRVQDAADRVIADYEIHRVQEERQVALLEEDQAEARRRRAELAAQREQRESAAAEVAIRAAEAQNRLAEQKELLDEIDDQISHIEGEIASLAREEEVIQALIDQETAAAGTAPSVLLRPVPGGVSSGFGWRIHPIYGDRRMHTGWDMNAGCGDPIRAAAAGRVFFAGWKGGYGKAVMIDHGGGMATLYAHQSVIEVSYGQQVSTGDVIGRIGSTGTSTACHLHWEVRIGGDPVDPSSYVR